jgi:type I restriction-modification system DNA methylase subunit
MTDVMFNKINSDKALQIRIKNYLRNMDIFNVTVNFYQEDVYNLCQLANYILYLKIIFYSYLQREVKSLNLKKIEIPSKINLLNKVLRDRFDDVLRHDYELIFEESVLDEFVYIESYLLSLKRNVDEIHHLNFKEINADIIGSIYNTLIDNQEQHDRGQHFTNTNEVDIICGFCIDKDTHFILDSGCGAGTFLVRAYRFLKYFHPEFTHQELLERLWGIDIAPFPVFLASMNLSLFEISCENNYPSLINKDFSEVESQSRFKMINLNVTKELDVINLDKKFKNVKLPVFDSCIGNPPYIRQELIQNKEVWLQLARKEFDLKKINQQSDLYVYYLIHTTAFLKEGGKFGYVISSSWLDTSFGSGLQKFLLDNFKILAIINNQVQRSFETASVNTVILIIQRCSDEIERKNNNVKFIRFFKD